LQSVVYQFHQMPRRKMVLCVAGARLTIHSSRTRFVASRLHLASWAGRLNSGVRPLTMINRKIVFGFVSLASIGWLAPAWLGVETMLSYFRTQEILAGRHIENPTYSFPYLHFASQCFGLAFAWLALVAFCWSYAYLSQRTRPNNSFKPNPLRSCNAPYGFMSGSA
jgi:hypothetical protein